MIRPRICFGWELKCKNCGHRVLFEVATFPHRFEFKDPLDEVGELECPHCREKEQYEGTDFEEVF